MDERAVTIVRRPLLAWLAVALVALAAVVLLIADGRPQDELVTWEDDVEIARGDRFAATSGFNNQVNEPDAHLRNLAPADPDRSRTALLVGFGAAVCAVLVIGRRSIPGGLLLVTTAAAGAVALQAGSGGAIGYGSVGNCTMGVGGSCVALNHLSRWSWETPRLDLQLVALGVLVVAALVRWSSRQAEPDVDVPLDDRHLARLLR